MVTDADVGRVLEVRVHYDETMDTRSDPAVSVGYTGGTLVYAQSYWTSDQDFRLWYTVTNQNVAVNQVGVWVTGARDIIGHDQNAFANTNVFSVTRRRRRRRAC